MPDKVLNTREKTTPKTAPPTLFGTPPPAAVKNPKFTSRKEPHPGDAQPESETELLRRLLTEQRAATMEARAQTADLQKQLAEAHPAATPAAPPETPKLHLEPDAVLIKVQWERTQKDLQRSQLARKRESEQNLAKLAKAEHDLKSADDAKSQQSLFLQRQFRLRLLGALSAAVVLIAISFLVAPYWRRAQPLNDPPILIQAAPILTPLQKTHPPVTAKLNATPDFTQAISRLSDAFIRFGDADPETVMRAVNHRASSHGPVPCAFDWNEGAPELQFAYRHGESGSLLGTLSRCADAVERFN